MTKKIIIFFIIIALIVGGFFLFSKFRKERAELREKAQPAQKEKELSLSVLNDIEPVEISAKKEPDLILKGKSDKTTDKFLLKTEKEAVISNLVLILNSLESAKGDPYFEILVYQVGKEEPIGGEGDLISLEGLKQGGWTPEESEKRGELRGTILGAVDLIEGPGEFYFVIDVENIDEWILELSKVKSPF